MVQPSNIFSGNKPTTLEYFAACAVKAFILLANENKDDPSFHACRILLPTPTLTIAFYLCICPPKFVANTLLTALISGSNPKSTSSCRAFTHCKHKCCRIQAIEVDEWTDTSRRRSLFPTYRTINPQIISLTFLLRSSLLLSFSSIGGNASAPNSP